MAPCLAWGFAVARALGGACPVCDVSLAGGFPPADPFDVAGFFDVCASLSGGRTGTVATSVATSRNRARGGCDVPVYPYTSTRPTSAGVVLSMFWAGTVSVRKTSCPRDEPTGDRPRWGCARSAEAGGLSSHTRRR